MQFNSCVSIASLKTTHLFCAAPKELHKTDGVALVWHCKSSCVADVLELFIVSTILAQFVHAAS